MKHLSFATGNRAKFITASETCRTFGVELEQMRIDVPEIQPPDGKGETVALDKVSKIFAIAQKPLVISDDNWMIPGLRNFPGPYMKHVNECFIPDDWIRLTRDLTNRSIILRQVVVYQDHDQQQLFSADMEGVLLPEPRGEHDHPINTVVSFDGGVTSFAEALNSDSILTDYQRQTAWHELGAWLLAK